jgi:hypothetical protein
MEHIGVMPGNSLPTTKGVLLVATCWLLTMVCKMSINDIVGIMSGVGSIVLSVLAGQHYWLRNKELRNKFKKEKEEEAQHGED